MSNKSKEKREVKTWRPLVNVFFTLLFCVLFPFVWWLFATNDFNNQKVTNLAICISVILIYFFLALGLNILFYYFKILNLRSFNINIPLLCIILWVILTSYISNFNIYGRMGASIGIVVSVTLLINFIIGKIEDRVQKKVDESNK
ncbi:hypothetical protein NPA07_02320 [Mycoplasmopsis caviae]|uniref:Uncharacterized protein n=1 Tax=Mycoplasmopsis caviae TaxID=55603 RepID=A0ABY5IZV7_9BACT|nr:hypothetical protein [Mycoplasmopsis caviae]UUD35686.1 hypothetical protein NPA07_02320 [Mycoplasmopsis caviae]